MMSEERFDRHGVPMDFYYYGLRIYMAIQIALLAWGLLGFPGIEHLQ